MQAIGDNFRQRLGTALAAVVSLVVPLLGSAETLSIPGSGNPEYALGRLAEAFNSAQTQHRVVIPPSTGTAGALRDLEQGAATLGRVGRPLKDDERQRGLRYHPLGRDAVVFVAGAGVGVRSITPAQAVDVYAGKLSNWKELGGNAAPIRAIGREPSDASRTALGRHIRAFENMAFGEAVKVVHLDPQMIELLDRYSASLGFLNRSALGAAKTAVVPLALDAVVPDVANLASGRYPVFLEFGLAYRPESLTDAGKAFLRFVDSPAGSHILGQLGIVVAGARP